MAKYTQELADQIIKLIKDGNFASVAFGAVGISHQTYHRWIKEKGDFGEAIKKAKADRITTLISAIKQDPSWQSKAWILERLLPNKFHLPTQAEKELNSRLDDIESKLDTYLDAKKEKIENDSTT